MTLVYQNQNLTDRPATHAVVIGVGAYAHLPGGQVLSFLIMRAWDN